MRVLYKGKDQEGTYLDKNSDGSFKVRLTDADGDDFVVSLSHDQILEFDPDKGEPPVRGATRVEHAPVEERDESRDESAEESSEVKMGTNPDNIVKLSIIGVAIIVLANY